MIRQTDPPRSPRETLPTMYDLPNEAIEETGLPDQYHLWQAELLAQTFCPPDYSSDRIFTASDLNLYYDIRHPSWYKRPDWFAVLDVDRLYDRAESRLSYVIWQEGVSPFVAIELLSPETEKEDLGQTLREINQPPPKWEVYEKILRIPYYLVFDRYLDCLRGFQLVGSSYQEIPIQGDRLWLAEINLGLGLWQGEYQNLQRPWLRWFDSNERWILTPTEKERQRADLAEARVQELLAQLQNSEG